jgi:3-dehydroquinate dehydratase/shikimate dehydrogenase
VRVCVPVCAKTLAELAEACARASQFADILELRLDCLESAELDFEIEDFAKGLSRPTILTLRPSEQGGYRVLERPERETFWSRDWSLPANSAFDIEADLVESGLGKFDWLRRRAR